MHLGTSDPLAPLHYSEQAYQKLCHRRSESSRFPEVPPEIPVDAAYCNRWRIPDFESAFRRAGFDVLSAELLSFGCDPSLFNPPRWIRKALWMPDR